MIRSTLYTSLIALALAACGGSQKTSDQDLLGTVQQHHEFEAIDVDDQPISIIEKRHLSVAFATYACKSEPVYFAPDSSALTPQAREQIKLISWCVRDNRANDLVVGTGPGQADTQVSAELDQARADAVRAYFTELGVDTGTLRIRASGDGIAEGTLLLPTKPAPVTNAGATVTP